jgi:hypothetical protein
MSCHSQNLFPQMRRVLGLEHRAHASQKKLTTTRHLLGTRTYLYGKPSGRISEAPVPCDFSIRRCSIVIHNKSFQSPLIAMHDGLTLRPDPQLPSRFMEAHPRTEDLAGKLIRTCASRIILAANASVVRDSSAALRLR